MDELLHHCLRELSFDGDLGCDASRLKDFIIGFYSQPGNAVVQNADDAFCSFVWSLVVQHPTVVVGLVPEGVSSEVWIAPQTSAKRKAKASGQEHVETLPARLEPIPNARTVPLDELKKLHGDRLRIALDPDAIFAGITGSHIRTSRLSPMVYTALQIITHGRDDGVTVVNLGEQSKYDQKTCFYLVRQLTEMDLVVKVRRGGVGTHFCIHKYFYDRSPSWKAIREEENRANDAANLKDPSDEFDEDEVDAAPSLDFTPIDSRHLSSLPLVKARVVKLLKASKNQIHASNNMLLTLGFSNPTKTDRRFFQSRIRELIQQGVIEKVIVPSNRKKANGSSVKCFRLIAESTNDGTDDAVVIQPEDDRKDDVIGEDAGVRVNITIHKQIIDLLEEAATVGMTLNELSSALNNFDKRTIELLLSRAEKSQPPRHLADLGIAGLMETSGRERRHRYYTVSAYQQLVATEQLDNDSGEGYSKVDIKDQGNFLEAPPNMFFNNPVDLHQFQDTFTRAGKPAKTAKQRQYKNPILPDGTVKQGRPRKVHTEGAQSTPKTTAKKRKQDKSSQVGEPVEGDDNDIPKPPKKKTRRGTGTTVASEMEQTTAESVTSRPAGGSSAMAIEEGNLGSISAPKRRGRPPKRKPEALESTDVPSLKRTRGSSAIGQPGNSEVASQTVDSVVVHAEQAAPEHSAFISMGIHPSEEAPRRLQPDSFSASAFPETLSGNPPEVPSQSNIPGPSKGRINVSHLRRENEIIRVLEESRGVINIQSKEFYETHMALLETLAKSGEPTSAPVGTRTDKRTVTLTVDSLERKGKVKQLKTSVATHTGLNKPATVVYLPSVGKDQLNSFLADISRSSQPAFSQSNSTVKIAEPLEYGADPGVSTRGLLPLQLLQLEQPGENKRERWSKNAARATQLFSHDDSTIRDILLTERTTVGQLYGFIVGKAARARHFHLSALSILGENLQSPYVLPGSRIIELSYFCQDVPVGLYTTFISALSYNDQLSALFQTDAGRKTLVKDLSQDLHTMLQVGRSRSRSRILDLLQFLRELQLVLPLRPSTAENAFISCEPHSDHPAAFDISIDNDWTPSTPHAAPVYWYFKTKAPIHLWHASESDPPLWKSVSIADLSLAREYWDLLRAACVDSFPPDSIVGGSSSNSLNTNVTIGRSLRRSISWNADYVLTWHQTKFLEKSIDIATGNTVLDESDDAARATKLQRLCWVTSAPQLDVEKYLKNAGTRLHGEKEKLRSKNKEYKRLKRLAEGKSSIAKKAEEARNHRENEWKALIARVHPGDFGPAASRIERVRARFMQAGSVHDARKWESEVVDAVREADLAVNKVLKVPGRRLAAHRPPIPNGASSGHDGASSLSPSVHSLIEQQEPLLAQGVYKRKAKSKKKASAEEPEVETEKKATRRHRFQWNKDYDDLAQDASVIIRARCRSLPRLEWAALEQVFPAVPRNTVRQRLSNLREIPGNDSYLRRLEDRWYELWTKYRGTDQLPDEQPESPSNFELVQHIEFLRSHVDKNALRIGFGQEKTAITMTIPNSVDELTSEYNVVEDSLATTAWDFVWNAAVEEGREKRLLSLPFTRQLEPMPSLKLHEADGIVLGEAALKMVMGSPPETYDCDIASALLRSVGEDVISSATQNLLGRGILSKSQRDPQKQKPGRQLKISDSNQNAIGGSIPRDTYQDATSLLDSVHLLNDWRDWPLTATDGDTLTLIHLVAENQVEFKIDTSQARAARGSLDWNSKRADDDQIETAILARYTVSGDPDVGDLPPQPGHENEMEEDEGDAMDTSHPSGSHGFVQDGLPTCCRKSSERGIVNCPACLQDSRGCLEERMTKDEKLILSHLVSFVREAAKEGRNKDSLKDLNGDNSVPAVLHKACVAEVPLLYWVGYTSLRLVAAEYASAWTVVTSEQPLEQIFPRRWLNIRGGKITDFWQAALRAVCALVVFRPGISQSEVRWRLRSVYDRQEILEVLAYMQMEGYLTLRRTSHETSWVTGLPLDDEEEKTAFWFIGNKCWYQV